MLDGKRCWMGLGPYPLFGLADARAKALDARRLRHENRPYRQQGEPASFREA
jgi:hypothetical protein